MHETTYYFSKYVVVVAMWWLYNMKPVKGRINPSAKRDATQIHSRNDKFLFVSWTSGIDT